jgi:hypothetical protein
MNPPKTVPEFSPNYSLVVCVFIPGGTAVVNNAALLRQKDR